MSRSYRGGPRLPLHLTPPQRQALQLLHEGWQCQHGGVVPPRFGKLLSYSFWRDGKRRYLAGSTLASLERRAWIAWEQTDVTMALDGRAVPGYALRLTPLGQQRMAQESTNPKENQHVSHG
jgi:hypothetical protein